MPFLFGLLGLLLTAVWGPLGTAVVAVLVGVLWKRLADADARVNALREQCLSLEARYQKLEGELRAFAPGAGAPISAAPPPPAPRAAAQPPPLPAQPFAERPVRPPAETARDGGIPPHESSAHVPTPIAAGTSWLIEFFTTGNVVAKAGMVIVFFGVAFLIRYAADRGLLPIEYRLMATAAGAVMLLAAGWRLRRSRPEYAVVLQGGAVGLLYLTIFAAFRLYQLLPASLTFPMLLVVVAVSGVLAILQNAMSLAVLGTSGGFLAPILASTGGGSHVGLFSYYAVLNAGVLGIAWFRAWRFLNWLAFVFTFAIGFAWGQRYYQPEFFATTEPFLVGFFLLFVSVAVLFAHRQPPQLRGYVDGSLVFGAPAIAFAMQSVLVRDIPFARAYSAAALGALYLALARWLWGRDAALRPLAEAFLAVAVVFLTLAVPFAFDGHATAAAWALQGAGLVWIGVRQHRRLARLTGCALLLVAGFAFAIMAAPAPGSLPVLNARFLGAGAVAIGSVMAAHLLWKARAQLAAFEIPLEWVLLAWGLLWGFGSVFAEIDRHVPARLESHAMLIGASAVVLLTGFVGHRLQWRAMTLATIPVGPLMWFSILPAFLFHPRVGPLPDLGWLAWPVVIASSYGIAFLFESVWPDRAVTAWHGGTTWLLLFVAMWAGAAWVRDLVPEASTWSSTVWCAVPAIAALVLLRASDSPVAWPLRRFANLYAGPIAGIAAAVSLMWVAWASTRAGSAAPLPYVPLVNPLELTQALGLAVAFAWCRRAGAPKHPIVAPVQLLVALLAFAALNAMVGRIVHFYLRVPFDVDDLARSYVFQAGVSILWGLTAGVLMTLARVRLDRGAWMMGAGLLAALILKLFLVDLGDVGGVARIVSFLATGMLILVIGYFAPVPPKTERTA